MTTAKSSKRSDWCHRLFVGAGLAGAILLVNGCVSAPPARPASLMDAEQAIEVAERHDAGHYAAAELDEARQKLLSADNAVAAENLILADRLGRQAEVTAVLATARTEATKAAAVNRELSRGIDALNVEMQRAGEMQ